MKNELNPWEVGLAEQLKGKEFSFDPQAFADFENLLQAESLGHEPGEGGPAPDGAGEAMSAAGGGSMISLSTLLIVVGISCFGGWLLWPTEHNVDLALPATETPATAPALTAPASTLSAPASTPTSEQTITTIKAFSVKQEDRKVALESPSAELAADEQEVTILTTIAEEVNAENRPPQQTAVMTIIGAHPIMPVQSMQSINFPVPEVQKLTPKAQKRDRKALFPDVIDKH